jgi:inorganic pyrophosphatase
MKSAHPVPSHVPLRYEFCFPDKKEPGAGLEESFMSCFTLLDTYDRQTGHLNAIIETPQGSRNKYKYDPELCLFKLHSLLPAGASFPYDFGFIPSTLGPDGDPLDILLLMEEAAPGGFLVPARLIGVIEAEQTDKAGSRVRNDRLIAVSVESHHHDTVHSLDDLCQQVVDEIEHFFKSYNAAHGHKFKVRSRHGPQRAAKIVKQGERLFRQEQARKEKGKKQARAAG